MNCITLSLARRQVAPDHPVAQLFGQRVPRGWVDAALPGAAANLFGSAPDHFQFSVIRFQFLYLD